MPPSDKPAPTARPWLPDEVEGWWTEVCISHDDGKLREVDKGFLNRCFSNDDAQTTALLRHQARGGGCKYLGIMPPAIKGSAPPNGPYGFWYAISDKGRDRRCQVLDLEFTENNAGETSWHVIWHKERNRILATHVSAMQAHH